MENKEKRVKEECKKVYGKMIKEDENFYYFEGIVRFGVTIPKNYYFDIKSLSIKERGAKMIIETYGD
jgi:hypothetical protein